jgi:hypothetical protein
MVNGFGSRRYMFYGSKNLKKWGYFQILEENCRLMEVFGNARFLIQVEGTDEYKWVMLKY